MDFIITIGLLYLAYRTYQWYSNLQDQARHGDDIHRVSEEEMDLNDDHQPGRDDDYIDYEEIREDPEEGRSA